MKLLKLTIHNIASIEHAEIDFQSEILKDEPLFLITGATGSGKTTILDAICLALYKKTPRMSSDSGEKILGYTTYKDKDDKSAVTFTNSNKLLLRRNTAFAFSELEFEDFYGVKYLARWEVSKAYKKVDGKIQDDKHSLQNLTTGITYYKDKEIENEILRCTGMNFTQFCRTCMLSQGEFTRFLKSKESEKSEILEKLTGTEIYSTIGKNIYDITKQKETAVQNKITVQQALNIMDENAVKTLEEQLQTNAQQVKQINESLKTEQQKHDYLTKLLGLENEKQQKLKQLQVNTDYLNTKAYKNECFTLSAWDKTNVLRNKIKENQRYSDELNAQKQSVSVYKNRFTSLNAGLKYLEQSVKEFESQYGGIEQLLAEKQKQILLLKETIASYNYPVLQENYQQSLKTKDMLAALETAFTALEDTVNGIKANTDKRQKLQQQLSDNEKTYENVCLQTSLSQKQYNQAKDDFEKIKDSLDSWAKQARIKLSAGDICPLCGQKISSVFSDKDFEQIVLPLQEKKDLAEKTYNTLLSEQNKLSALKVQLTDNLNDLEKEHGELSKKETSQTEIIKSHCKKCNIDYNASVDRDFIRKLTEENNLRINQLFEKITQTNKLNQQITSVQNETQQLLKIKQKHETELMLIRSCTEVKKSLSEFTYKWENSETKPYNTENIIQDWNAIREDFFNWKHTVDALREKIKNNEEYVNNFFSQNQDIDSSAVEHLLTLSETDINRIAFKHKETENNIQALKGALNHIENEIKNLQSLNITVSEDDTPQSIMNCIDRYTALLSELQNKTGAIQHKLKENEEKISAFSALQTEIDILSQQRDKWQKLNMLFGSSDGKKFRSIAQGFILGDLLSKANYYLQRFSDRYTLTSQDNSLAILICDKYEGGLISSSANLSGGESFMVSLSLALGLARMSSLNAFSDILFIDEGFGTLSSECLNTVMDTLEKLHQMGGRKVGIISHVPELKERISAQITVKRTDNTKSVIDIVKN
ncbi:MAG: hypothetical protein J6M30_01600 [Bacteroidales bacterium]|nr:hypothetical protein [Bacteroidales bacterium]